MHPMGGNIWLRRALVLAIVAMPSLAIGRCADAGASPSDGGIQQAINLGFNSKLNALWKGIKKHRSLTITSGWPPGDTVTKKVVFVTDLDRVALTAAERKRRLQPFTVAEARQACVFGTVDVRLQASANGVYQMNVTKWAAPLVYMVLRIGDRVVQPLSEAGTTNHVEIPFSQTGVVSQSGNAVTYTPLYQTYLYDNTAATTWFAFPKPTEDFEVVVISADGHSKEKSASLDLVK